MSEESSSQRVRLEGITKQFGDVTANDAVDFTLEKGTIHALLGENGSGKTTLMSVLYGLYSPTEGTISVAGEQRTFESPREAMDAGIGMIHQHFQLVEPMTVLQNIILGNEPTSRGVVDKGSARRQIREICDRYGFDIDDYLDTPIREFDLGTQQRTEIVKSLYRGAEILIFDEPTAVLTPQEVSELIGVMEDLAEQGRSIVFITHKLSEALTAADRITVLRDGTAIDSVASSETDEQELARMMVGREVSTERPARERVPGDPVLEVTDLVMRGARDLERVSEVDLTVREGEILGIAGVQGNGQSELVEGITGLRTPESGTVRLNGTDITDIERRERIEAGIAYIPEDRQSEGLVQDYDLVRNALLGNQTIEPFSTGGTIDWQQARDHATEITEEFDVRPRNTATSAASLSGGNQQKYIVGREIGHDPDVIVASHPTRGVDIGSIEFIHDRLMQLREEGVGVLLVSSKLDEVQRLADRIAVMYEGRFIDTVDPETATEEDIGLLMAGHDSANEPEAQREPRQ